MTRELPKIRCNQWRGGVCAAIEPTMYCPRPRAENAGPGECCHHPLHAIRPKLEEMKKAGVKLARYRDRLGDLAFVERLYAAFLKARRKRS